MDNCSKLESTRHVTMATLVKNALRMRPDRIVVGEVRGEEARDLMTAVNVGKYTMGTLHASTARETIMRLENEPMRVPGTLVNLVDVFVVLRRLNVRGKVSRRVVEVAETAGPHPWKILRGDSVGFPGIKAGLGGSIVLSQNPMNLEGLRGPFCSPLSRPRLFAGGHGEDL